MVTASRARHRLLGFSATALALLIATPLFGASTAAAQDADAPSYPEAVIVADITDLGCTIESTEYTADDWVDGEFTDVVSTTKEDCPPGSVLSSVPTTLEEAVKSGQQYIVTTGDFATDEAAVAGLKTQMRASAAVDASNFKLSNLQGCRGRSLSKSTSYWGGATGAGITSTAFYYQATNCNWYLSSSRNYIFDPLSPGEDIYWDDIYVHYTIDAGCIRMYDYGTYRVSHGGLPIQVGVYYADESINSPAVDCDWWGEEYISAWIRLTG